MDGGRVGGGRDLYKGKKIKTRDPISLKLLAPEWRVNPRAFNYIFLLSALFSLSLSRLIVIFAYAPWRYVRACGAKAGEDGSLKKRSSSLCGAHATPVFALLASVLIRGHTRPLRRGEGKEVRIGSRERSGSFNSVTGG